MWGRGDSNQKNAQWDIFWDNVMQVKACDLQDSKD